MTSGIAGTTGRLWGLTAALTTDERTGLTGTQYTAPLREDMLRALSQSVPPDARNGLAQQRLAATSTTVNDLFNAVTIVNPGGSYTLATEHSPLAAGAAQRPAGADPGTAAGRRAARA